MAEIIQFPVKPIIAFQREETKAYLEAVMGALGAIKEDCLYLQGKAKDEHNDNAYIRLRDVLWNLDDVARVIGYILQEQL